jgi:LPS export ABC transporter protein LptC
VAETESKKFDRLKLRAKVPFYFRIAAVCLIGLTILGIGIGFYRAKNVPEFRMKGFPTALSKDVVAVVNGYERREVEGDTLKYYIKADRATTFSDNHQEMENVFLQVFDPAGASADEITASKAVYIPGENKNFTAYFAGSVHVATRDGLKVRTEQVSYKRATEIATADEAVEFERLNVKGKSFGAVVNVPARTLELLRDVRIETVGSPRTGDAVDFARLSANYAIYDQGGERIDVRELSNAHIRSAVSNDSARETDVKAGRAAALLVKLDDGSRDLGRLELFENVAIESRTGAQAPTIINAGYAVYEKAADRFDLKNGVHIVTVQNSRPTELRSASAVYEQSRGRVSLEGNAEVVQASDFLKGDTVVADLFESKSLKAAAVRGNAFLRQITSERTTEITASELNAAFADGQNLSSANALGKSSADLVPANASEYSRVSISAASAIRVRFKGEGAFDDVSTDGRTTIRLNVPDNGNDSANKQVTADAVRTSFDQAGKNIQKAEAVGNGELIVEPHRAGDSNYKTVVNAARFDCDFYPTGNNARNCTATPKTRTVRIPTVQSAGRGNQTIIADRLDAHFSAQSKDVERFEASGGAKFSENDRNAIADRFSFTPVDATVRLRGGEPSAWDASFRVKSSEIDWDTRNQRSYLRGSVSTTYYNQRQTGGAAPFGDPAKPVFLTADSAEIDHRSESAIYTGNARGWQEKNYVRANRLEIRQREGTFAADGSVQSLLYDVKRKENGKESTVPVYAAAATMTFDQKTRRLRYENSVDIRQGGDRIVGGAANVYLDAHNELVRTDIESNVIVTQPNRRASGDFAQYTAADERVILKGSPARVEDAISGSAQGSEVTVFLRGNRVIGEGKSKQDPGGRMRSVFKIKNNK